MTVQATCTECDWQGNPYQHSVPSSVPWDPNRSRTALPEGDTHSIVAMRYAVKSAVIEGNEHHAATGHAVSVPKGVTGKKQRVIER
jgi:hypothetical protein